MIKIKPFEDCVTELSRLPGIGRKSALRLALFILKNDVKNVEKLADSILNLKKNISVCKNCYGISEGDICQTCADPHRKKDILCVVEDAKDVFIIESSGRYNGVYHVLGGRIAPLDGIGPEQLRIGELLSRVDKERINEVILATNPDIEGETTAIYIRKKLAPFKNLLVTRIASGIPIGSHIEYADEITILKSLENRREMI